MDKKMKQRVYEPPMAVDLSAMSATGGLSGDKGECVSGTIPYYNCIAGPDFTAGFCTAGGSVDTSACVSGGYHTKPACNTGASAATICISGAHQQ